MYVLFYSPLYISTANRIPIRIRCVTLISHPDCISGSGQVLLFYGGRSVCLLCALCIIILVGLACQVDYSTTSDAIQTAKRKLEDASKNPDA